ncbi:PREDICTED: probable purine permease 9 [Lupinus angustifolius]|uniref:probable purine permease 9 n=1 Tax=Lupinus angustifolius TaxID=3871 RepID=UPI00092F387B|nr:PREDICTED: probable purine permease 9 [Lupinus angustifolius]
MFQTETESEHSIKGSKKNQMIRFICTIVASVAEVLLSLLTQLTFEKVLKREIFNVIMDVIIYQAIVAICVAFVEPFASGKWKGLRNEMDESEMAKISYVLNLVLIAITWQLYFICSIWLIFEVSSLFVDVLSVLAEPIVQNLAVIFFHETMNGIKAISMVLALWGFISYIYHHYGNKTNSDAENIDINQVNE